MRSRACSARSRCSAWACSRRRRRSSPAASARGSPSASRSAAAATPAVPLAHSAGGWRTPLLVFGIVSTFLAGLWLWLTRSDLPHERVAARPLKLPWRRPLAWRLVAAFFLMSSVFYGLNAWLPDVYVERGWSEVSAGNLLAVLNTVTIPVGFAVAWAADHWGQ